MRDKKPLEDQGNAMLIQKHQLNGAQSQSGCIGGTLDKMLDEQRRNQELLDSLMAQAELVIAESSISIVLEDDESFLIEESLYIEVRDAPPQGMQQIATLDYIDISNSSDWGDYQEQVLRYANRNGIDLKGDPFRNLMSISQRIELEKRIREEFSIKVVKCDKYDYMIAGTCGLIGGFLDVFFVGIPGQGGLTGFADELTDKAVQQFASYCGWKGPREGKDPTASAIGFLEGMYKVNYDHRHGGDVDRLFDMSTRNHHIKSLGHSPDMVGLFFSILDQFNSTAHFVDNGRIISVDTETFELKGSNFTSKLIAGFANWLGHLFSDVAGSSGALGRGSGIPIPFYSLLQFINVGQFGQHRQSFAKIVVQVFEQGYDLRHGIAMAIPVLVTELLTRIMWVVKRRFYHDYLWSECIPTANDPELRRMLLIAHGSLCLVDTTDATLRSGGNIIQFLLRSNMIAWIRFGTLALKELQVWYKEGGLDIEAIDDYLDAECERLLRL